MLTAFRQQVTEALAANIDMSAVELLKFAGVPPPLPAAARLFAGAKKAINPMEHALFSGMQNAPKTNVVKDLVKGSSINKEALGKMLGELLKKQKDPKRLANIARLVTSRGAQQLEEGGADAAKKYLAAGTIAATRMAKAAELTESAREDLPKKDFAAMRAEVAKKYPNLLKKQAMLSAAAMVMLGKEAEGLITRAGRALATDRGSHIADLVSLGALAAPSVDEAQAHIRARAAGDYNKGGVKKRTVLPHAVKPAAELGGLAGLAATTAAKMRYSH